MEMDSFYFNNIRNAIQSCIPDILSKIQYLLVKKLIRLKKNCNFAI